MINIKRQSDWTFKTSQGRSSGIANAAFANGTLFLTSPEEETFAFHYASLGIGIGLGAPFNDNWSTTDMYSDGIIWVLEGCPGPELKKQDFIGNAMIVELAEGISGDGPETSGVGIGKALDGLLMGIDSVLQEFINLELEMGGGVVGVLTNFSGDDIKDGFLSAIDPRTPRAVDPRLLPKRDHTPVINLQKSAKALLITKSDNKGSQFTAGGTLSYGAVWADPGGNKPRPRPIPPPVETPKEIRVILPGDVLFDFDKDFFKPSAKESMILVGEMIKANAARMVEIHGHTDNIGNGAYNYGLSFRRAQHAGQWLVKSGYITNQQVAPIGHSFSKPVATNRTSEGRAHNRRVEFAILKKL